VTESEHSSTHKQNCCFISGYSLTQGSQLLVIYCIKDEKLEAKKAFVSILSVKIVFNYMFNLAV